MFLLLRKFLAILGVALSIVWLTSNASGQAPAQDKHQIGETEKKESGVDVEGLKTVIAALFRAYEEENSIVFMEHVHGNYISLDFANNRQDVSLLRRSVHDDFKILDGIQHKVFVKNIFVQKDGKRALIEIRWCRRAFLSKTRDEWNIREQESQLMFEKNSHWKLLSIQGKPLFGLADLAGNITIAEGTLNNHPVTQAIEIGVVREKSPKGGM